MSFRTHCLRILILHKGISVLIFSLASSSTLEFRLLEIILLFKEPLKFLGIYMHVRWRFYQENLLATNKKVLMNAWLNIVHLGEVSMASAKGSLICAVRRAQQTWG